MLMSGFNQGYVLGWPLRARRVYHFHPTILVTNHQINQEASQILRDNLFVKLTNIVTGHGIAFELEGLPVVAENELASRITCSVIELSLVINNGATYEPWSSTSVFAGDDINTFCRVLLRSSLQSSLSIAVALDAQSTTSSLKLLEPFHRLHSLETANITGQLSNDYKSGLIASLLRQAPGFDTVIQEVKNTIREGDQAGTDKDYPTAIARYKKALEDNEDCRKFAAHDVKCGRFQKVYHRAVYMGMALALNEKLALTYLESKNYSRAHKWAKSGLLLINPFSEEMKLFARFESLAAQASEALGLLGRAAEEMADAVCYDPEDSKMAAELARLKLKIQSGHGDLAGA